MQADIRRAGAQPCAPMQQFANHRSYLGIPFSDEDRGRDGLHCYALARMIYRCELGIEIGDYGPARDRQNNAAAISQGKTAGSFVEVSKRLRKPFDLIVYAVGGIDDHIAIAVDERWMIHAVRGDLSRTDALGDRAFGRVSGVYRHEALT